MNNANEFLLPFAGCTPQQRAEFINQVTIAHEDGWTDTMKLYSAIKNLQTILTDLEEYIKPCVIDLANENGGKVEMYGVYVEKMEGGVKYDYTQTNDIMYGSLAALAKQAADKVKERENWLKSLPAEGVDIVDDNGEVVKVYRPIKSSTTTVKAKLK